MLEMPKATKIVMHEIHTKLLSKPSKPANPNSPIICDAYHTCENRMYIRHHMNEWHIRSSDARICYIFTTRCSACDAP